MEQSRCELSTKKTTTNPLRKDLASDSMSIIQPRYGGDGLKDDLDLASPFYKKIKEKLGHTHRPQSIHGSPRVAFVRPYPHRMDAASPYLSGVFV